MKGLRFLILMLPLLLVTFGAQAHWFHIHKEEKQQKPLTIVEKLELAEIVVEGKVVNSEVCIRQEYPEYDYIETYTLHTIDVYKIFKGSETLETIQIITEGGWLDETDENGFLKGQEPQIGLLTGSGGIYFLNYNSKNNFFELLHKSTADGMISYGYRFFFYQGFFNTYKELLAVDSNYVLRKGLAIPSKKKALNKAALANIIVNNHNNNIPAGHLNDNSLLIIEGENFGTIDSSLLFFQNSVTDNGELFEVDPSHIQTFTNTLIEVWVPSIGIAGDNFCAGSGKVQIINSSTTVNDTAEIEISIPYAISNSYISSNTTYYKRTMVGFQSSANVSVLIKYDTTVYNNKPALEAIRRGLEKWRCATNIKFEEACPGFHTCSINNSVLLSGQTLASAVISFEKPGCINMDTIGTAANGDIINPLAGNRNKISFNTSTNLSLIQSTNIVFDDEPAANTKNWYYGEGIAPQGYFNFETTFLHEFAHFLGLKHVNDQTLMYFGAETNSNIWDNITDLTNDPANTGANQVKDYSLIENTQNPPILIPQGDDCSLSNCFIDNCSPDFTNFPITITPACPNADGSINVNVGTLVNDAIYDIVNSANDTIHSFTGGAAQPPYSLAADTYVVHISDVFGCYGTDTFMVDMVEFGFEVLQITPNCNSQGNGGVTVDIDNIDSVVWTNMANGQVVHQFPDIGITSPNLTNQGAGDYIAVYSNNEGCMDSDTITIEDGSIALPLVNITNVSNPFVGDGVITIDNPNNTYNYTIVDLLIDEAIAEFFAGSIPPDVIVVNELCAGDYELTITNDLGCTYSEIYTIDAGGKSPAEILDDAVSTQCNYVPNGNNWDNPDNAPVICMGTTLDFDFSEFAVEGYEAPVSEFAEIEQDEDNPHLYHIYWYVPGFYEVTIETLAETCGSGTYSWYINVELEDCGISIDFDVLGASCPPDNGLSNAAFYYTLPIDSPYFQHISSSTLAFNAHFSDQVDHEYSQGLVIEATLPGFTGYDYFFITSEDGCGSIGLDYQNECCADFNVTLKNCRKLIGRDYTMVNMEIINGVPPFTYTAVAPYLSVEPILNEYIFESANHGIRVYPDAAGVFNPKTDIIQLSVTDALGCRFTTDEIDLSNCRLSNTIQDYIGTIDIGELTTVKPIRRRRIVGPTNITVDVNHKYNLVNCDNCIGVDWEAVNGDIVHSYVNPRTRTDINWDENAETGIVRARATLDGVEHIIELEVDINLKSIVGSTDEAIGGDDKPDVDEQEENEGDNTGDGINCDALSSVQIYPNPIETYGVLEFYLTEVAMVSATVVNIDGVIVHTFYDNSILMPGTTTQKFRGSKFNAGMYYLHISVEGCEPQAIAFVVI